MKGGLGALKVKATSDRRIKLERWGIIRLSIALEDGAVRWIETVLHNRMRSVWG
jgi:hypothetical protein